MGKAKEENIVDARGLSCPQPVILAQKAMQSGASTVTVWVDTVTARENVSRMARFSGWKVNVVQKDDEFQVVLNK